MSKMAVQILHLYLVYAIVATKILRMKDNVCWIPLVIQTIVTLILMCLMQVNLVKRYVKCSALQINSQFGLFGTEIQLEVMSINTFWIMQDQPQKTWVTLLLLFKLP